MGGIVVAIYIDAVVLEGMFTGEVDRMVRDML